MKLQNFSLVYLKILNFKFGCICCLILWKVQLSRKNLTLYIRNNVYFSHIFSATGLRNMFGTKCVIKLPMLNYTEQNVFGEYQALLGGL